MSVIDATDPTDPKLVGTCTTNYARYVAIVDTFAYVADAHGGMQVVNVANPAQPLIIATYPTAYAAHVQQTEGRVYLSAVTSLVTFDPAQPADPRVDGYYDMAAVASATSGDICYVVAGTEGLWILKRGEAAVSEPDVPAGPRAVPYATVVRGVLRLESGLGHDPNCRTIRSYPAPVLLDISGRKVMDLVPGENDVRHIAPGVYLVRTGPAQGVTRVVIAR